MKLNYMKVRKRKKDCRDCKNFRGWDKFDGQFDEYGRCEIAPYIHPVCTRQEEVDKKYDDLPSNSFTYAMKLLRGKGVCVYFKKKSKRN